MRSSAEDLIAGLLQTATEFCRMLVYQQRLQKLAREAPMLRGTSWHGEAPLIREWDDPSKQQPAWSVRS